MRKNIYMQRKRKQIKQPNRHTHSTAAGIEDALAVAWDIIRELDTARTYTEARAKKLIEILKIIREGPRAYDQERASGQRVVIKKR